MNRNEVLLRWADALESGNYTQVRGTLKKVEEEGSCGGMCCLGVYVDILHTEGELEGFWDWDAFNYHPDIDDRSGQVVDDLDNAEGEAWLVLTSAEMGVLVRMNDGLLAGQSYVAGNGLRITTDVAVPPNSFAEIATHIRDNLVTAD